MITNFWESRDVLRHVRDVARSRMVGPYAVLAYSVAEALANVPPYVCLPPIIGGAGSLNLCVGVVGGSGAGKGTAASATRDGLVCSYPYGEVARVPLGSGEGMPRTYRPAGTPPEADNPVTAAIFTAEEIDTWAALATRTGSTISAEVRKMYSGEQLGFGNAGKDTRNIVKAHSYRGIVIVGIQPERSGPILDAADGGLPQRFWWVPASDPDAPDTAPASPDQFLVTSPKWHQEVSSGKLPSGHLGIPDSARELIVAARLAVLREEPNADPLAGHALQTRLKIAAGLMALDGRSRVDETDWTLAGHLMDVSDQTRLRCQRALVETSRRANTARALATAERDEIVSDRKLQRARTTVLRKIDARGQLTKNQLRMAMKADIRDYLDTAISDLLDTQEIAVSPGTSGTHKVHVYHRYIHEKLAATSDDGACTESTYVPTPGGMPAKGQPPVLITSRRQRRRHQQTSENAS